MWANEQEAAVLCGLNPQTYRRRLTDLEAHGFPKKDPLNRLRYIPAIEAFWAKRIDGIVPALVKSDETLGDNDNGRQPGKWGASKGPSITRARS